MKFVFIAKHRTIWPVAWLCDALGVSGSGFHAWLNRSPSARSRSDEELAAGEGQLRCQRSDLRGTACLARPARRRCHYGLHRIERLMRLQQASGTATPAASAEGAGDRQIATVPSNILDRQFAACDRTRSGLPTSPTSGRPRAGSMWRP